MDIFPKRKVFCWLAICSLILVFVIGNLGQISVQAASPIAPTPPASHIFCDQTATPRLAEKDGSNPGGNPATDIARPCPRFTSGNPGTVTDRLTGLVWTRDADAADGYMTWQQALDHIKTLNSRNHLGHNDWRLPNVNELESLVNQQADLAGWFIAQGFFNIRPDYYWTSTTYASYCPYAWGVCMYSGMVAGRDKASAGFLWPVRTGSPGSLLLAQTGQTACYDKAGAGIDCVGAGQDGELQIGVPWPSPRFVNNSDETITDRLSGLIWSRDGRMPGPADCRPSDHKTYQEALDYIACLNAKKFLGKDDWRLPDRDEMKSLVSRGQANSSSWLNSSGFQHVQGGGYWTSSAYFHASWNAWIVNMHDGAMLTMAKKHDISVWPVRTAE